MNEMTNRKRHHYLNDNNLILISNREPYSHEKTEKGILAKRNIGGVVSVLDSIMQFIGGVWIAWGSGNADFIQGNEVDIPAENPRYKIKRIKLSEREISKYYRGFANRALWPIFHLFLESAKFEEEEWKYYRKVNQKFALAAVEELTENDLIWVHDYHLSLVPDFIRKEEKKEGSKIAFFWHIPWVNWDAFSDLPWREDIFKGLLGSDLIGFHIDSYVNNFLECAEKIDLPIKSVDKGEGEGEISYEDRTIKVKSFPIGINYRAYKTSEKIKKTAERIKRREKVKIIFGIDRLDYTKGLLNKLLSFERFLHKYPEFVGKVTFLQVVTPSRTKVEEYKEMKRKIEENVGRINGLFQNMNWVPIKYFYRHISHEWLLAYYSAADVALVTPLVDGMNLVAKEYIAANEEKEENVLILSEFAGASEELTEAIIVNPYDIEEVADAIKTALDMSKEEKRERFRALKEQVKRKDSKWWFNNFMDEWCKKYENLKERDYEEVISTSP